MEATPETLADAPPPPHPAVQTLENPINSGDLSRQSPESRVSPSVPDPLPDESVVASTTLLTNDEESVVPKVALETLAIPPSQTVVGSGSSLSSGAQEPELSGDEGIGADADVISTTIDIEMPLTASPTSVEFASTAVDVAATDVPAVTAETSENPSPLPESIATTTDVRMPLTASPTSIEFGCIVIDVKATDVPAVMVETSENPSPLLESIAPTADVEMPLTASPTSVEFGSTAIDVAATSVPAVTVETSQDPSPPPESIATTTDLEMPLTASPTSVEFGNTAIDVAATDVPAVIVETSESPSPLPKSTAEKDLGMMELVDENRKSFSLKCDAEAKAEVKMSKGTPKGLDKMSSPLQYNSIDVAVILSEFLSTAINPLHLKWHRFAKTVRGFFSEYRSSFHGSDVEFQAYLDCLNSLEDVVGESAANAYDDGSKEANSVRKRNKRKSEVTDETLLELGHDKPTDSGQGKGSKRRKMMNCKSPMVLNGSESKSQNKRKGSMHGPAHGEKCEDVVIGDNPMDLDCELNDCSKVRNLGQKRKKNTGECKGGSQGGSCQKAPIRRGKGSSESKSQNKRKGSMHGPARGEKCKDVVIGDNPMDLDWELNNCSKVHNLGQKRKKNSGECKGGSQGGSCQKTPIRGGKGSSESKSHNKRKGSVHGPARGKKCEDVVIGDNPMDLDWELSDCSEVGNLWQKRKKNSGECEGGSQGGSRQKAPIRGGKGSSQQKKNIEKALSESPAALILTFAPDTILPSRDELISTFSSFGSLMDPKAEILQDSNSARVVFLRSSDAEKAFNSPDRKTAFASQLSSCRFRYLPEVKSPLPYIKRTLSGMISRLTRSLSGKNGAAASWSKMEGMEDLVGSIKSLLDRVDKMTDPTLALSP